MGHNADYLAELARDNILGVGISPITLEETINQIAAWIEDDARRYISACTVHTVMECQRDPAMRHAINQAGLAVPDGMPLVWLARRHSQRPVSRVYGPDLMLALCQQSAARGYRHYFWGGAPGVPEQLVKNLQAKFPGLAVAGVYSPPFQPLTGPEDETTISRLNQARADVIWVGLGTPKQDLWMAANRPRLTAPVLIGVGAAFDFHTGRIPQAPKWMQRSGLEWLFRLWQEPRRLAYRYLVYNPLFVFHTLAQLSGLKQYPLEAPLTTPPATKA